MTDVSNRRPLKSRGSSWAQGLARDLAKLGVSPDQISFFSLAFALLGACAFAASGQVFGGGRVFVLILAAAAIQLRLVCNLLDGMVAVEHGKGGPHGPIWNELPDRLSDAVLMMGAGLAASPAGVAWGVAFGAVCALLAVLTAYVRELGRGLGFPADFSGPMAKPQRMGLLTAAALRLDDGRALARPRLDPAMRAWPHGGADRTDCRPPRRSPGQGARAARGRREIVRGQRRPRKPSRPGRSIQLWRT